ncbi:MAG: YndJ family transporter [Verrucomicrobiaceae bacterium]
MNAESRNAEKWFGVEVLGGLALWTFLAWLWDTRIQISPWVVALLMLSPLLLIRIGERHRLGKADWSKMAAPHTIAVTLLAISFMNPPSIVMAAYAVPWFIIRLAVVFDVMLSWRHLPTKTPGQLCFDFAFIFPAIGAAWLVAQRANWTPWNFDPLIVLLTAAHFHHAGFTLPLMAGLNAKAAPGCWTRFSCVAILAGVPLVAAGITCTHFGVLRFVEPFGVTVLVLGALGVAVSQIRRGMEKQHSVLPRLGFVISGASLLSAMILAMGFGLRHVVPNWALTMPQMWMIHGTLNAFGFGLCGLLAWRGVRRESGTGLKPVGLFGGAE